MTVPQRYEILRVDCPTCRGNGYTTDRQGVQHACGPCGGVGMLERRVDYRAEGYTLEEAGEIMGVENPTNKLLAGDPALERRPGRSDE